MNMLAVIGAGQMGQGIALTAARAGRQVLLADSTAALAERGKQQIEHLLRRQLERGKLDAQALTQALERVTPRPLDTLGSEVDIAIEAIPEQLELKARLFSQLEAQLRADAVLASNTSSVSITALGAAVERPQRVIGMHFFNPVPVMDLVELIRGLATDDATLATARTLAERMGKRAVLVAEAPGFLVNRILIPMLNEAVFTLEAGLASAADIDLAMRLGTHQPMGPLALADLIGLDTVLAICETLHRELGDDKYRPAPLLRRHVLAGWLGKKTQRGFHVYG
ncbi:MAG TPA: 3-hydroxyacyl-CoA dehydrogenase NAD-binding domain-containing protein [Polyangiales bacterium]|nr:3-hydroxyacyl-CoA dehydrogenase NAD-binding domain-containing protein [Polyangiales bacterium]